MGKKRSRDCDGQTANLAVERMETADSSSDEETDIVNVDFELFNYDSEIDLLGVKHLCRQLLDADAALFDLSALSHLITKQDTIGSTCKVDGKETDAYAFVTVLSLREHRDEEPVSKLMEYIVTKAKNNDALVAVAELLRPENHVGLVLADRLLNMPVDIVAPMWTMLMDEVEAAVEDKEPYDFTHYLVLSRTYHEVASSIDDGERKKKKVKEDGQLQYFHPEDEEMRKHAMVSGTYQYTNDKESVADSKRAFQEMGIKPRGFMMLIEAGRLPVAVQAMSEYIASASS